MHPLSCWFCRLRINSLSMRVIDISSRKPLCRSFIKNLPFCSWIKITFLSKVLLLNSKAYSKPYQTSKMELLQKVFNSYQTFAKSSILDTWQGFKYASEIYNHSLISIIMITLTSILLFAPVMLSQIDQSFAITIKSLIDFKVFTFDKTEKKNTSQKENYTTHTFFHHI